tara:strand:+ start:142 stop:414 length:273 start_codon:yes stop_codon:yes gene_type:complete
MDLEWLIRSVIFDTERMIGCAYGGFMLLLLIAAIQMSSTPYAPTPPVVTCQMAEDAVANYCRSAKYMEYEFTCKEDERGLYLFDAACEED